MINNRAESAKSNAYGINQNNINMSSAQPGEDGLLTGDANSAQMDAHLA